MTRRHHLLPIAALFLSLLLLDPSRASAQTKPISDLPFGLSWDMMIEDVIKAKSMEFHEDGYYLTVDSSYLSGSVKMPGDSLYGFHYWDATIYTTTIWGLHEVRVEFDGGENAEVAAFRRISAGLRADYGPPDLDSSPDRFARQYNDEEIAYQVYEGDISVHEQWQDTVDGVVYVLRHEIKSFRPMVRWYAFGVE